MTGNEGVRVWAVLYCTCNGLSEVVWSKNCVIVLRRQEGRHSFLTTKVRSFQRTAGSVLEKGLLLFTWTARKKFNNVKELSPWESGSRSSGQEIISIGPEALLLFWKARVWTLLQGLVIDYKPLKHGSPNRGSPPCIGRPAATVVNYVSTIKMTQQFTRLNLLNPTGHVMHQQFNIQQL